MSDYSKNLLKDMSKYLPGICWSQDLGKGDTVVRHSGGPSLPADNSWEKVYSESYPVVHEDDFMFYLTPGNIELFLIDRTNVPDSLTKATALFLGISYFSSLYSNEVLDAMYHKICTSVIREAIPLSIIETTNWNAEEIKRERSNTETVSTILPKWKEIQEDQLQLHLQLQSLDNQKQYGDLYGRVCQEWLDYAKAEKGDHVQDTSGDKSPVESPQLSDDLFETLGEIFKSSRPF